MTPSGLAVLVSPADACPLEAATAKPRSHLEFEAVALVHHARLRRAALALARNVSDAEDLVQETYLRAFHRFDSFAPGTDSLAWLRTILRHVFINRLVRTRRDIPAGDGSAVERGSGPHALTPPPATPEEEFFRRGLDSRGWARALDSLSPSFRAVLVLAHIEERSYREIAELYGLPVGTVMSDCSARADSCAGRCGATRRAITAMGAP